MTKVFPIKAVCLKSDDYLPELIVGEIYDVEWMEDPFVQNTYGWLVKLTDEATYKFDSDYNVIVPEDCFMSVADWRDKQINDILKDD